MFAGWPDEEVRKPEERRDRHQEPQVVRTDRVDRSLPEEGKQADLFQAIFFTMPIFLLYEYSYSWKVLQFYSIFLLFNVWVVNRFYTFQL